MADSMNNQTLDFPIPENPKKDGNEPPEFQGRAWEKDGMTLAVGMVPRYSHPCLYSAQGAVVQVYAGCRTWSDAYDLIAVLDRLFEVSPEDQS